MPINNTPSYLTKDSNGVFHGKRVENTQDPNTGRVLSKNDTAATNIGDRVTKPKSMSQQQSDKLSRAVTQSNVREMAKNLEGRIPTTSKPISKSPLSKELPLGRRFKDRVRSFLGMGPHDAVDAVTGGKKNKMSKELIKELNDRKEPTSNEGKTGKRAAVREFIGKIPGKIGDGISEAIGYVRGKIYTNDAMKNVVKSAKAYAKASGETPVAAEAGDKTVNSVKRSSEEKIRDSINKEIEAKKKNLTKGDQELMAEGVPYGAKHITLLEKIDQLTIDNDAIASIASPELKAIMRELGKAQKTEDKLLKIQEALDVAEEDPLRYTPKDLLEKAKNLAILQVIKEKAVEAKINEDLNQLKELLGEDFEQKEAELIEMIEKNAEQNYIGVGKIEKYINEIADQKVASSISAPNDNDPLQEELERDLAELGVKIEK